MCQWNIGFRLGIFARLFCLVLIASCFAESTDLTFSPNMVSLHDEFGRQLIPQGFVVITEDNVGPVYYTKEDYRRMVRYGANCQVVRLVLGKLGGWPGYNVDYNYLERIDGLVRMGKELGIATFFKLTTYDVEFDSQKWDELWYNRNNAHEKITAAWKLIWKRYRNEPSVLGYDLINEPHKGLVESYEQCERDYLVPLYRRLIDELHKISRDKWALYQPLIKFAEDRKEGFSPFADWHIPLNRDRIIYSPHIYEGDSNKLKTRLDTYQKEAALSNAKIMIGEWGRHFAKSTDCNLTEQLDLLKLYIHTNKELDARMLGTIKAWFCGTRQWYGKERNYSWAIFKDAKQVGLVERKFIIDGTARPRPLAIAGQIKNFSYDYTTRKFQMAFVPAENVSPSELYIPADRHYPDGFVVMLNSEKICGFHPGTGFHVIEENKDTQETFLVEWNSWTQRLIIEKWHVSEKPVILEVVPGFAR
jgi:hypothetical protein